MGKLDRTLKGVPPKGKLKRAFHEVFSNVPSTVKRANVSGLKRRKMMIAIAFAKARRHGR